jgi:hypothetical protein
MLKITYVGPFSDGVEVPALGVVVAPGETVEVADDDVALNLLEQAENWEPVSASAASRKRHTHETLIGETGPEVAANETADTPKDGE